MNATTTAGETAIVSYSYEGTPIAFARGRNLMVNATQMAAPFGKLPANFLNTQRTKEFINELATIRKTIVTDLVRVINGGKSYGTWMHEDVAMEFARWLSPKFAIWCNDRIKELLTQGVATVADDDAVIARSVAILQHRLAEKQRQLEFQQREAAIIRQNCQLQEEVINTLQPKADYYDDILCSDTTYTFTQIACDLHFRSVHALMDALHKRGIVYKQSGQWLPTAKYSVGIVFANRTTRFVRKDGTVGTSTYTVVTEAGRAMLHSLFDAAGKTAAQSAEKGGEE